MRRRWIWPVLLVLVMGLTACQVEIAPTPKPDGSDKTSDPAPVPPPPDSGTANPDTGNAAKPGLSGGIAGWLRGLSPGGRRLFLRRYWYGEGVGELAQSLGERPGRLSLRLFRLRGKLREHLEKEGIAL